MAEFIEDAKDANGNTIRKGDRVSCGFMKGTSRREFTVESIEKITDKKTRVVINLLGGKTNPTDTKSIYYAANHCEKITNSSPRASVQSAAEATTNSNDSRPNVMQQTIRRVKSTEAASTPAPAPAPAPSAAPAPAPSAAPAPAPSAAAPAPALGQQIIARIDSNAREISEFINDTYAGNAIPPNTFEGKIKPIVDTLIPNLLDLYGGDPSVTLQSIKDRTNSILEALNTNDPNNSINPASERQQFLINILKKNLIKISEVTDIKRDVRPILIELNSKVLSTITHKDLKHILIRRRLPSTNTSIPKDVNGNIIEIGDIVKLADGVSITQFTNNTDVSHNTCLGHTHQNGIVTGFSMKENISMVDVKCITQRGLTIKKGVRYPPYELVVVKKHAAPAPAPAASAAADSPAPAPPPIPAPRTPPTFIHNNPAPPITPPRDDFFEPQQSLGCGRHALNNLLGGVNFINEYSPSGDINNISELPPPPVALQTICRYLRKKTGVTISGDNCPDNEYYDHYVLEAGMRLFGYTSKPDVDLNNISVRITEKRAGVVVHRDYDAIMDEIKSLQEGYIGFTVHLANHWTTIKKLPDNSFRYIDSLNRTQLPSDTLENIIKNLKNNTSVDVIVPYYNTGITKDYTDEYKARFNPGDYLRLTAEEFEEYTTNPNNTQYILPDHHVLVEDPVPSIEYSDIKKAYTKKYIIVPEGNADAFRRSSAPAPSATPVVAPALAPAPAPAPKTPFYFKGNDIIKRTKINPDGASVYHILGPDNTWGAEITGGLIEAILEPIDCPPNKQDGGRRKRIRRTVRAKPKAKAKAKARPTRRLRKRT